MPNYYQDIKKQIPLTKDILWGQLKSDYGLFDSMVTGSLMQEDLKKLTNDIMIIRTSDKPLGFRFVEEYKLRRKVKEYFDVTNMFKILENG